MKKYSSELNLVGKNIPFSYDLIYACGRHAAIFRPYPMLGMGLDWELGKPIYVEALKQDEPYPFKRRDDIFGKNWWDLRYLVSHGVQIIAPTIIGRDFAIKMLDLRCDKSLILRHLVQYPSSLRETMFCPYSGLLEQKKNEAFMRNFNTCVEALGLEDVSIGLTGSLLIDPELKKSGRDMDLVIQADSDSMQKIANEVRSKYLNITYKHVWPLRAVLVDGNEIDLFFVPPNNLSTIIQSFRQNGCDIEEFSGIVLGDKNSIYAPTILECDSFICLIMGTAARGEFRRGDRISGRGIAGEINFKDSIVKAYLIEDAVTQLVDIPRTRS